MRDYDNYYGSKKINIIKNPTARATVTSGTVFIGVRVQNLLLKPGDFYKQCGFFTLADIQALKGDDSPGVSGLIISNTNDADRLSVITVVTR